MWYRYSIFWWVLLGVVVGLYFLGDPKPDVSEHIIYCLPDALDTYSDESIHKYVGKSHPFQTRNYRPTDLVPISGDFITTGRWSMMLRQEAMESLHDLSAAFFAKFGVKLDVVSGYRSYERQAQIAESCSELFCARPGYSEHQWWLAMDIFMFTNAKDFLSDPDRAAYYARLMEHAHSYGRHNSYQKWAAIDGYAPEPRHWRYLGVLLASRLHTLSMTFAECMADWLVPPQ
jgi:D-alanyl-D-alanine carboxypeptidase